MSETLITYVGIGKYQKGFVKWDGEAWLVMFPYIGGDHATYRETERYGRRQWFLAMSEYREHGRNVMRSSPTPML